VKKRGKKRRDRVRKESETGIPNATSGFMSEIKLYTGGFEGRKGRKRKEKKMCGEKEGGEKGGHKPSGVEVRCQTSLVAEGGGNFPKREGEGGRTIKRKEISI